MRSLRRGQSLAAHLLADAVCDHVENPRAGKPLVASLHGSPGIGKSYFHQLLAQALYNATATNYDGVYGDVGYDGNSGGGGESSDAGAGGSGGDGGGGRAKQLMPATLSTALLNALS